MTLVGSGAKVYALCGAPEYYGEYCEGDDCISTVECPTGTSVISCRVDGLGDGAYVRNSDSACIARGRGRGGPVRAVVTCSDQEYSVKSVVSQSGWASGTLTASCSESEGDVLSCNCYSPWKHCGEVSVFSPSDDGVCRMTLGGSGKVYALCRTPVP